MRVIYFAFDADLAHFGCILPSGYELRKCRVGTSFRRPQCRLIFGTRLAVSVSRDTPERAIYEHFATLLSAQLTVREGLHHIEF